MPRAPSPIRWRLLLGLTLGLLCCPAGPSLRAADSLSFNLERVEDLSGDFPLVFYTFHCGSQLYTFCPPALWTIAGDVASMSFSTATSDGDAIARFRASTAAELALLDPAQRARREAVLRTKLPAGATEVSQVGTEETGYTGGRGRKEIGAIYHFNFFGRALGASIKVCQLDEKNGFTLVAIAPADEWENFYGRLSRTLSAMGVTEDRSPNYLH